MSDKIPVLNEVALALGVWATPCNNDKVSFGNEGLCSQGRHREEDRRTEKSVWGVGGIGENPLHLVSNITPPGYKHGLHENPL